MLEKSLWLWEEVLSLLDAVELPLAARALPNQSLYGQFWATTDAVSRRIYQWKQ